MMFRLIVVGACLAVALSMPQPGFKYEYEAKPNYGLKPEDLEENPIIQKILDMRRWFPWISVRTYGRLNGTDNLDTFTRAEAGWRGIKLFGDFATSKQRNVEFAGVGGDVGELARVYYAKDLKSPNQVLEWEGGI